MSYVLCWTSFSLKVSLYSIWIFILSCIRDHKLCIKKEQRGEIRNKVKLNCWVFYFFIRLSSSFLSAKFWARDRRLCRLNFLMNIILYGFLCSWRLSLFSRLPGIFLFLCFHDCLIFWIFNVIVLERHAELNSRWNHLNPLAPASFGQFSYQHTSLHETQAFQSLSRCREMTSLWSSCKILDFLSIALSHLLWNTFPCSEEHTTHPKTLPCVNSPYLCDFSVP